MTVLIASWCFGCQSQGMALLFYWIQKLFDNKNQFRKTLLKLSVASVYSYFILFLSGVYIKINHEAKERAWGIRPILLRMGWHYFNVPTKRGPHVMRANALQSQRINEDTLQPWIAVSKGSILCVYCICMTGCMY